MNLFSVQIMAMQLREGRSGEDYNYGRAFLITGKISINGRAWRRMTVFDYIAPTGQLEVGKIRDFVVVDYVHKNYTDVRGRVKPKTLKGRIVFVRARKYRPTPIRESNMWLAPAQPKYQRGSQAIAIMDVCAYLHVARERNGRVGFKHLIKVAQAFV